MDETLAAQDSPTRADIKADTETLVHEVSINPSNADIVQKFEEHTHLDEQFQDETRLVHAAQAESSAEMEGKLADIHEKLKDVPTKSEMAELVEKAMGNVLKSKGKTFYAGLLVTAGIVGALVIIGGGAKALLGWIGFTYMSK